MKEEKIRTTGTDFEETPRYTTAESNDKKTNEADGAGVKNARHQDYPKFACLMRRGKVQFALLHRDDMAMDTDDPRQRKIVIICEETSYETAN